LLGQGVGERRLVLGPGLTADHEVLAGFLALGTDRIDERREHRIRDHGLGCAVAHEISELARRGPEVDGHRDRAELVDPQYGLDELGAVEGDEHDAVARGHPAPGQRVSEGADITVQLRPGGGVAEIAQRLTIGVHLGVGRDPRVPGVPPGGVELGGGVGGGCRHDSTFQEGRRTGLSDGLLGWAGRAEGLPVGAGGQENDGRRFSRIDATPSAKSVEASSSLWPACSRASAASSSVSVEADTDLLVSSSARRGPRASRRAALSATAPNSVGAGTSTASPRSRAEAAETASPRSRIREATDRPTAAGNRTLAAPSGMSPMLVNANSRYASSAMNIRSAARASETPTPAAGPLTAAITGIGAVRTERTSADAASIVWPGVGAPSGFSPIAWRSAPVEKAPPSPRRTTTRVAGSPVTAMTSSVSARTVPWSRAFILSGLLMPIVAIPRSSVSRVRASRPVAVIGPPPRVRPSRPRRIWCGSLVNLLVAGRGAATSTPSTRTAGRRRTVGRRRVLADSITHICECEFTMSTVSVVVKITPAFRVFRKDPSVPRSTAPSGE